MKTKSLLRLVSHPFTSTPCDLSGRENLYQGYAKAERLTLQHELFRGGKSEKLTRELFISGDAVVVIPYDVTRQEILLIEQFRVAPLHRGEHPWLFEGIAGRIEPGEAPHEVANREADEEAGCQLNRLEKMGGFYQSPGIFAEHITYYCASADLKDAGGIFGLAEEDEDIRAVVVSLDEALEAVDTNRIASAPTALALLWIARHQERLTRQWSDAN